LRDAEFRFYGTLALGATALVAAIVLWSGAYREIGVERAIRDALFQVVSIGTTTGFVTRDYELWP
ncbi:MAG: TrkH family potassium uptake protein, partial [Gemmatimonadetes bacterium]|nr:TrkH family potassium uptake protein [Gemmatimonadota bacterium]NIQ58087.1 TrkH family potassium uptake protein [Gemmatimonadota bacterium]NIU78277.1 TrkH family potassium uptake protein [Gammaproteobacteria bacterium]NIX47247.1 TrkH family potassium uptake protein [Gemmatimonadota bacterium]NIY11211.1 TrkH family potassium uptake protein [Gemmatimonadota bacterium]